MVFSEYEERIYNLALNLTGDEGAALQVTHLVHDRLNKELHKHSEPVETLIHRFTYDAALPLLLERAAEGCCDIDACCTWLTGEKHSMVC